MFELVASRLSFEISSFYQNVTILKKLESTKNSDQYLILNPKKEEKYVLQIAQNKDFIPDFPRTLKYEEALSAMAFKQVDATNHFKSRSALLFENKNAYEIPTLNLYSLTLHDLKDAYSLPIILQNKLFKWSVEVYKVFFKHMTWVLREYSQMLVGKEEDWDLSIDDIFYDINHNRFTIKLTPRILSTNKSSFEDLKFLGEVFGISDLSTIIDRKHILQLFLTSIQIYDENYQSQLNATEIKGNKLAFLKKFPEFQPLFDHIQSQEATKIPKLLNLLKEGCSDFLEPDDFVSPLVQYHVIQEKQQGNESDFSDAYQIFQHFTKAQELIDSRYQTLIQSRDFEEAIELVLNFIENLITHKRYEMIELELTRVAEQITKSNIKNNTILMRVAYINSALHLHQKRYKEASSEIKKSYEHFNGIQSDNSCKDSVKLIQYQLGIIQKSLEINKKGKLSLNLSSYIKDAEKIVQGITDDKERVPALNVLGNCYWFIDDGHKAIKAFRSGIDQFQKYLGESNFSPLYALSYLTMGDIYRAYHDRDSAIHCYENSQKIGVEIYESNHPNIILAYERIGLILYENDEYKKSVDSLRRALHMKKMTYGENSIEVAATLNLVGAAYNNLGRQENALENYIHSRDIFIKHFGEDHITVATQLNNIACVQKKLQKTTDAIQNYEKSLTVFLKHYDESHPIIGTAYSNLGCIKEDLCEYEPAIDYYLKAEKIFKGDQKPEKVASIYFSLGRCYDSSSDLDRAESYYQRSLKMAKQLDRIESSDTARIYKALGDINKLRKQLDPAYENYQLALQVLKKIYPEPNYETSKTYNQIGTLLYSFSHLNEAIENFDKSLEILQECPKFKNKEIEIGYLYNNMAACHRGLGDVHKALEYYEKAYQIFTGIRGKDDPTVAVIQNNLATILKQEGDFQGAVTHYKASLKSFIKIYGDYHPTIATLFNNVATLQYDMHQYGEALYYFSQTIRIYEGLGERNKVILSSANYSLGKCHFNLEEYEKSIEKFVIVEEMYKTLYPIPYDINNCRIAYSLAEAYRNVSELDKSLASYEKCLEIYSLWGNSSDPNKDKTWDFNMALVHYGLGMLYNDKEDSIKSLDSFETALDLYKSKLGEKCIEVAQCNYQIGVVHYGLDEYDTALEKLDQAFAILEKIDQTQSEVGGCIKNHTGLVYQNLGQYNKSSESFKHSLAIRKKVFGKNPSYDLACSNNNVGLSFSNLGEYGKAFDYFTKAYDIIAKLYGEGHREMIGCLNNMGSASNKLGKFVDAICYFEKALKIRKENTLDNVEDNNNDLSKIYNNLGSAHLQMANFKEALEYYSKSLDIRIASYGEVHQEVATIFNNLALVQNKQGNYTKALEYHTRSYEIRVEIYGRKNASVAVSLNNIGQTYQNLGDQLQALKSYEESKEILTEVYGTKEHPKIATIMNNIAVIYKRLNKFEDAIEYHNQVLEVLMPIFGENHPEVAMTHNNLGEIYADKQDWKKSLEEHEFALEVRQRILYDNHPDLAASYNNCASVYKQMGDYKKAIEYYEKSLEITKKAFGDDHNEVSNVYLNLSSLYDKMGEDKQSNDFQDKYLNISMKLREESSYRKSLPTDKTSTTFYEGGLQSSP